MVGANGSKSIQVAAEGERKPIPVDVLHLKNPVHRMINAAGDWKGHFGSRILALHHLESNLRRMSLQELGMTIRLTLRLEEHGGEGHDFRVVELLSKQLRETAAKVQEERFLRPCMSDDDSVALDVLRGRHLETLRRNGLPAPETILE